MFITCGTSGRRDRKVGAIIALALTALACIAFSASSGATHARAGGNDFLVHTGSKFGFGPFAGSSSVSKPAPRALRRAFGPPSRTVRSGERECELVWGGLGIRVSLVAFGSTTGACANGTFVDAVLTDKRWHTPDRVRVGSSKRKAKRESDHACDSKTVTGRIYCRITGYVFGTHRTDCSLSRSPNVIAHTSRRRVLSLVVYGRGCE